MNLYDVLHYLIDRTPTHDAAQAGLLHDAVTAQAEGYKSAEEYRKAQEKKAAKDDGDGAGANVSTKKAAAR